MASEQARYWNDPAVASDLHSRQSGITEFAEEFQARLRPHVHLLEIGCGAGDDAAYFAEKGHKVTAIDVSQPLLDLAAQRYADLENLDLQMADITQPLNISGQSVDAVYARLSLHYFDHQTTLSIFGEIAWVLRSGGQFFFACRSTQDPLYGRGRQVEPDIYELRNHVRHFFTPDYATDLLEANGFVDIDIREGQQELYGDHSAYIKCSAMRP